MNRWRICAMGLVMVLLTGVSLSRAQVEGTEENEFGVLQEAEGVAEPLLREDTGVDAVPPEDAGIDALLLDEEMTMFELIMKGGVVGGLIILLSCVALGLVIDYAITIRRVKLAPPEDIAVFRDLVEKQDYAQLKEMAKKKPTFLSDVLTAALEEIHLGYPAMIKAMEDTAEANSARYARRIEHLNVIGNISPMMGLLGTVIGMLRCFNEISQVSGSIDPKLLAAGIFEALVTTCLGLIVAIPTLYFYAIFRNRLDELAGEASVEAEQIVASFKPDGSRKGT